MPTVNEQLRDIGVHHSVYLERYKSHVVNEIMATLNKIDASLMSRISTRLESGMSTARLEMLLADIRSIGDEAKAELDRALRAQVGELSLYEVGFQIDRLQSVIPVQVSIVQPSPQQLYAAVIARPFQGVLLQGAIDDVSAQRQAAIEGAIRQGYAEGKTQDQIIRDIRGTRKLGYRDGLLERKRYQIAALTKTATQHIASVARDQTYSDNARLIKGVQWVATLDNRTTMICASLDGQVFDMDSGPRPPAHWNCRSTTVPVVKSWKELGYNIDEAPATTRASMNGQVAETTTYPSWLKKQSAEVQREVLGASRYEMFKSGTPIEQFVSDNRVLTLDELKKKEAA